MAKPGPIPPTVGNAATAWPPPLQGRAALLVTALLFSTGGAVIKYTPLSGLQIAGLRAGLGAIVLLLLLRPPRGAWTLSALAVGACQGATLALFALANKLTTATGGIFLQYTASFYVLLLSPLLLKEPISHRDWAYIALFALGAIFFFLGGELPQPTASDPRLGNLLGLASGATWAATLLGLRWLARDGTDGAAKAAASVVLGNALVFFTTLPWLTEVASAGISTSSAAAIGWLGVFQVGIAYVLLQRGFRTVRAVEASLLLLVEPVLAVAITSMALGETQSTLSLIGAAIILSAAAANAAGPPTRAST